MKMETISNGNVIAEIELSYKPRLKLSSLFEITSSQEGYSLFIQTWDKEKLEFVEQFKIMLLNNAHRVLGICTISTGNSNSTIADPRLIFAVALKSNACNIILAHNHPSGKLVPGESDVWITENLVNAGRLLNVKILDHLIISNEGYYSFADEGAL